MSQPNYVRTDGIPSPIQQEIIDETFYWDCISPCSNWMRLIRREDQEVIGHYRNNSHGTWDAFLIASKPGHVGSRWPDRVCASEDEARDFIERAV